MPRGDGARGQPDGVRHRLSERKGRGKRGARIDPSGYDAGKKIKGKKRHILVDTVRERRPEHETGSQPTGFGRTDRR